MRTLAHRGLRPPHEWVVLARVGGFTLVYFGVFAGLGGVAAAAVTFARQAQAGFDVAELAGVLAVSVPLVGVLGARLWALAAVEARDLLRDPWGTLPRTTLAWQGAFALVTAWVVALALWRGLPALAWIDTFAFGLPVGQAFGRLGCHTYGCCHGRPSAVPWAITVTEPASKVVWGSHLGGVPLHPAQLYAFAANVAVGTLLGAVAASGPLHGGTIAAVYLIADGALRFVVELFRGVPVGRWGGLTPFQLFACAQAGIGLAVASASRGEALVDFSTGLPLADVASMWPLFAVCGAGLFALTGVHRGDPGGLTAAATRTLP